MDNTEPDLRHFLDTPAGGDALRALSPPERLICGPLIGRIFARSSKLSQWFGNYGPAGAVQLAAATAWRFYLLPPAVLAIWFAFTGRSSLALIMFALTLAVTGMAMYRAWRADREGKSWRNLQHERLGDPSSA